jgi:hypothetical protein
MPVYVKLIIGKPIAYRAVRLDARTGRFVVACR